MLAAAKALSEDFRFMRVDLYDTPQKPLFGELTLAPEAGLCRFDPRQIDLELGASWSYPDPAIRRKRLPTSLPLPPLDNEPSEARAGTEGVVPPR